MPTTIILKKRHAAKVINHIQKRIDRNIFPNIAVKKRTVNKGLIGKRESLVYFGQVEA